MPIKKPKSPEERKKSIESLEALNPEGDPSVLAPGAVIPEIIPVSETPAPEVTPPVEEEEEIEEEEAGEAGEEEEEKIDWKKRHDDSTREAQILVARQKKEREIREKAKGLPEPTETDLRVEYPEWDDLTPFEQRMAKDSLHQKQKLSLIESIDEEVKLDEEFVSGINSFLIDPKVLERFPKLEGMEAEFAQFAQKPSRRSLDLEDIATIFSSNIPDRKKAPKGSLMERGSAAKDKGAAQSKELTPEQMTALRKNNFKLWTKLTMAKRKAALQTPPR